MPCTGLPWLNNRSASSRVWKTGMPECHPVSLYQDERISGWRENHVYKLPSGEIVAVYDDVTEQKQADQEKTKLEERLFQSQKMEAIGNLAGGIAHDINNILSVIMGYTELAYVDVGKIGDVGFKLGEVLKAGKRIKDLVNQILTFSRQSDQEKKPIDICAVLDETITFLRASLPTTIEIRKKREADTGIILADPTQIQQVLMNLCTNAGHAMQKRGGILAIDVEQTILGKEFNPGHPVLEPGTYIELTVSDTGHGMEKEVMDRIFEPYYTTKPPSQGTGMGLSVVHGIVTNHEGAITVSSKPGLGTSFHVFFPTLQKDPEQDPVTPPLIPSSRAHILFVDDEKVLVDLAKEMLNYLGHEVVVRTSSVEALETFRTQPDKFDLVITDMTMPNMTGLDLATEMLEIRPHLPIILCTGFSENIFPERIHEFGIRELLMKPLLLNDLARALQEILVPEKA